MLTIFSEEHRKQAGKGELIEGTIIPCVENPGRADAILDRVRQIGLGAIEEPDDFGLGPITKVHSAEYVDFLRSAWDEWRNEHGETDGLPTAWPVGRAFRNVAPKGIDAKLGYYSFDAGTPLTQGTWTASYHSAQVALTAAARLGQGLDSVFALCRPPGHHAGRDFFGGYCFLNNAAIAAEQLRGQGCERVAILDVDYHHGNGTQAIFYDRSDVLYISIHADPAYEFPYYLGYADETGEGSGEGFNLNFPLPWGSGFDAWGEALSTGCSSAKARGCDALVVSLGVDTFEKDPISRFKLGQADFPRIGEAIRSLRMPTLFVMEGGYALDELAENASAVLTGFENAA